MRSFYKIFITFQQSIFIRVHPNLNMLSTFRNRNNKHLPTGEESRHVTVNRKDQLLK